MLRKSAAVFAFAFALGVPQVPGVEKQVRSRHRLFWQLQICGWLLLTPFGAAVAALVFPDPGTIILIGVFRQLVGFGLTIALWLLYRRWPAADFKLLPHLWAILVACIVAAAIDFFATETVHQLAALPDIPIVAERGAIFVRFTIYVAWSALYFVIRQEIESRETELRLARAEAANREAELLLLRAQVNPHFLFNALNAIIGLAERNPNAVIETTHSIADYLRYSLSHGIHRAPLGEELEAMRNYLRVERANYADRIEWAIDATPAARDALAPTALVQPLIENAVKYGIRTSPAPLRLNVTATVDAGELIVAVENTGQWIARAPGEETKDSTGIGLNNLRRRLALLCGEKARLEIGPATNSVRATIRLPYEPAPVAAPETTNALPASARGM